MISIKFNEALKQIFPPILWSWVRSLRSRPNLIEFKGNFKNWESAARHSEGYDSEAILNATRSAMSKVKSGQAIFERDSVLLDHPEPPFPLLSGLLRAATLNQDKLSVLDFGGALGSTYFQCRPFLDGLKEIHWNVVEQPNHVECGKAEFASDVLRFYESAEECVSKENPNVLILSCVLQYLPSPYKTLRKLLALEIPHVILDRTAISKINRDYLTVQQVPSSIYSASYPAWFLSKTKIVSLLERNYTLRGVFECPDKVILRKSKFTYEGYILQSTKTKV